MRSVRSQGAQVSLKVEAVFTGIGWIGFCFEDELGWGFFVFHSDGVEDDNDDEVNIEDE